MKLHFKVSLTLAIGVVIIAFSALTLLNIRLLTSDAGRDAANQMFHLAAKNVDTEITHVIGQSYNNVSVLAALLEPRAVLDEGITGATGQVLLNILREYPALYSAYIGFDDNAFFQVIAAHANPAITDAHKAPANTIWISRRIVEDGAGGRRQDWVFYDRNLMPIDSQTNSDGTWLPYFPGQRPWFQAAREAKRAVLSDAYIFHSSKEPGITASRQLAKGQGVAGVDLTLSSLESFLKDLPVSANGELMILDDRRRLIAQAPGGGGSALLETVTPEVLENAGVVLAALGGEDMTSSGMFVHTHNVALPGSAFDIAILAPMDDFLGAFDALKDRVVIACLIGLVGFLPIALIVSGRMSTRLVALVADARRIRDLDFTPSQRKTSSIIEFNQLEDSFRNMRGSLREHSEQLHISQEKLNRLVELGIAMSSETDNDKVMDMLLQGARELSNADGGTLYLIEEDGLAFQIILNESLEIRGGGVFGDKPDLPAVPLYKEDGSPNRNNVVSQAVHAATTIHIPDVYENKEYNFTGTRSFDELHGYRSKSFLTVPLKPRGGNVIGAIQILNPLDEHGEITGFDEETTRFIEALSAQAATVIHNRDLVDAQEELMDSLIQLIGGAIDTKSPYTGGHCERVPELAMMLAREASDSNDGIMADFRFETQEEWREFSIGVWLHDCGKVVTPEYVVDKATKLETIYNRIHEVRTRFEVLLRDAEIHYLKAVAEGGDRDELNAIYETEKSLLIDDFAFVAECNVGSEFMADDKIARLKGIAGRYWTRNFDIKLGLSHEEEPFYANAPDGPVAEQLLDDKPWHVIPRRRNVKDQYEELGFKTPVPENLYNRGEIYNLSVQRGTLSEEERFKINEHIMQTIAMLERLPFPDHLKRVPEYAGTHHETLTGTGYPRQLGEEELSVPARVVAIADIFEALTASDRPYKKAKTLSEAVKILSFFKKDRHIDGELFDLFLTSGVYLDYAHKFLSPDQIDEVDISQYLG